MTEQQWEGAGLIAFAVASVACCCVGAYFIFPGWPLWAVFAVGIPGGLALAFVTILVNGSR